jgi:hypothetical protein
MIKLWLEWAEHVARMGKKRNAYKFLVGNPEGKIPLGRPSHIREDNNEVVLKEIMFQGEVL